MPIDSNFSLMLPYRLELLNVVTAFVSEIGQSLGANEQETLQLRLAAEEVFTYIMEAFPASEKNAVFYLRCEEGDGNVTYRFSNHGTPLNVRATPEFAASDMEATIAGLGLSLVKQITDHFEFINHGNDGWLIVFSKQLSAFQSILKHAEPLPEAVLDSQQSLGLHVKRATTAHVPKLIDLLYQTYRYSYPVSDLYDEKVFAKAIEDQDIVSIIVETGEGKIVGNCMLHFASPYMAEVGSLMTAPHYRATSATAILVKETLRVMRNSTFNDTLFYANLVTTHTNSQRLMQVGRLLPIGLLLSLCDCARFLGINEVTNQRESCVFVVLSTRLKGRNLTAYAPPEHQKIIDKLLTNIGMSITWPTEEWLPLPSCTHLTTTPYTKNLVMEIQVNEFGLDFSTILKKQTLEIQQNGFLTCLLTFPLDKASPVEIDQILKDNKYFFSGLQIKKDGKWYLLYTNLFHQRFQFASIALHDPIAIELRHYMEEQYLQLY